MAYVRRCSASRKLEDDQRGRFNREGEVPTRRVWPRGWPAYQRRCNSSLWKAALRCLWSSVVSVGDDGYTGETTILITLAMVERRAISYCVRKLSVKVIEVC